MCMSERTFFCKTLKILLSVMGSLLVFLIFTFRMGMVCAESDIPEGLAIVEIFKPGIGLPVGKVQLVQGEAIVIHKDISVGYKAENDMPLFEGDMVITREKGRIRFELNDGSILTMASKTEMTINQSLYDSESGTRSAFLKMLAGKARFIVKKLTEFKLSEFKLKTKTAVIGVRGSDFIVAANADRTEVTALENTDIEVVSLIGPEAEPAMLKEFEHTVIEAGALPSKIEEVFPEDIEILKRDFISVPDHGDSGDKTEMQKVIADPELREAMGKIPPVHIEDREIFVPNEALVNPEEPGMFGKIGGPQDQEHIENKGSEPKKEGEFMKLMPDMDKIVPDRGDSPLPDFQDKVHEDKMKKELPPSPDNSLPPFPEPPGKSIMR
ncbi:MAG: hypothetical protein BWK80_17335 [Desulfobacteraceae bacterium IS3]|nr:MAG: hypothetical protein BWK80_17335 [Desulfobacteraceae bacterium IS3]